MQPVNAAIVIREAFEVYRTRASVVFGLSALLQAILVISTFVALNVFGLSGFLVVSLMSYLINGLATGSYTTLLMQLRAGETPTIASVLSATYPRMLSIAGATLAFYFCVGLGSVFFLLPGVFLATRWLVYVPSIVADHLGPSKGLGASWHLTEGRFGSVFVIGLFQLLILILIPYLVGRMGEGMAIESVLIVQAVITALFAPFAALALGELFLQLCGFPPLSEALANPAGASAGLMRDGFPVHPASTYGQPAYGQPAYDQVAYTAAPPLRPAPYAPALPGGAMAAPQAPAPYGAPVPPPYASAPAAPPYGAPVPPGYAAPPSPEAYSPPVAPPPYAPPPPHASPPAHAPPPPAYAPPPPAYAPPPYAPPPAYAPPPPSYSPPPQQPPYAPPPPAPPQAYQAAPGHQAPTPPQSPYPAQPQAYAAPPTPAPPPPPAPEHHVAPAPGPPMVPPPGPAPPAPAAPVDRDQSVPPPDLG